MNHISLFRTGERYSILEIQSTLGVGNAGGVRVAIGPEGIPRRMVVLTAAPSARQVKENPYHDRVEGYILTYTGAGREGDQSLGGVNQRIPQQTKHLFPIYAFSLVSSRRDRTVGPKRWQFLGLLEYRRHYPETQVDSRMQERKVWLFEFRILSTPQGVVPEFDLQLSSEAIKDARAAEPEIPEDGEVVGAGTSPSTEDAVSIESVRAQMLSLQPVQFEHLIVRTLARSGFERVTTTRYSQDGGIDVNAYAGQLMWPVSGLLLQVQAKRWLHTAGRKEVAELRGSLQPHARGTVITTSHFSRAAINEASEPGKIPIVLVDGFAFAKTVRALGLLPQQ